MPKSNINVQAQRASMKVTGRKNQPKKGKKPIKVGSKLRKKILEVIKGDVPHGITTKVRQFPIGMLYGTGAGEALATISAADGIYAGSMIAQGLRDAIYDGHQATTWAGHLNQASPWAGYANGHWNFFTAAKVADSAAVLFNNKAFSDTSYATTAGNFFPEVNDAGTSLGSRPLKIFVKNSYVQWELKNCSARVMIIDFYHCTTKLKYAANPPLDVLRTSSSDEVGGIATLKDGLWNQQATLQLCDVFLHQDINVQPNFFKTFNNAYKYEKFQVRIQPGETCVHSIQGPKNMLYDFSKFNTNGVDYSNYITKHATCVFAKVYPDVTFSTSYAGTVSPSAGHFMNLNIGADGATFTLPIACTTKEFFEIAMPEPTGWIVPAGGVPAAGSTLINNFRKGCRAHTHWPVLTAQTAGAGTVIMNVNEENPTINFNTLGLV